MTNNPANNSLNVKGYGVGEMSWAHPYAYMFLPNPANITNLSSKLRDYDHS